jgi:hypothetical protein
MASLSPQPPLPQLNNHTRPAGAARTTSETWHRLQQVAVLPHECVPGSCKLSSGSWDGFGHQLDAKLSCIASAAQLGMEYIHVPFRGHAHGEALRLLDELLAFNRSFRAFEVGMRTNWRQRAAPSWWPAPYGRKRACDSHVYHMSWLRLFETNASWRASWALCCEDVV